MTHGLAQKGLSALQFTTSLAKNVIRGGPGESAVCIVNKSPVIFQIRRGQRLGTLLPLCQLPSNWDRRKRCLDSKRRLSSPSLSSDSVLFQVSLRRSPWNNLRPEMRAKTPSTSEDSFFRYLQSIWLHAIDKFVYNLTVICMGTGEDGLDYFLLKQPVTSCIIEWIHCSTEATADSSDFLSESN